MPPVKKKPQTKRTVIIPKVDMTPVGNVNMFLNLFKNLLFSPKRTIGLKIAAIIFGFIFLTLGLFTLAVTFWAFQSFGAISDKLFQGVLGIPLGLLFVALSLKMIYINLREI